MAVVVQAARGADRARELRDAAGLDLKALLPPYLESEQEKSEEVRERQPAGHMLTAPHGSRPLAARATQSDSCSVWLC